MVDEKERPPMLSAMLAQVRPGTDVEAAETLRKVIAAVQDTGKVGSLVVRLDVKPADGGIEAVVVTDKLTAKIPEKTRIGSLAFITKDGDLSRTDPSAMPLFTDEDIRDAGAHVDPRTGEIKEAPGA
ncbi:hypothetical protein [uncultured Microbacterium sp.]|uniref:hypothetical protein n=1 Tax=uncultured Microbacterium sp. TaxID=191216 RepID=UPI0025CD174E|nr:hypothetical protein [uncultured Microbacterium sp.]